MAQLAALAIERGDRLRRAARFVSGGAIGAFVPFVFLLWRGDVRAWARITFVEVPAMYRFIWPRPASVILSMPGYRGSAAAAAMVSAVLVAAIVVRRLPVRCLPLALVPVLGVGSVLVQAKGFPYHFHPVTLGTTFGALVVIAALVERGRALAWLGAALATALAVRAMWFGQSAPYLEPPSREDPAHLASEARLGPYERVDYFPYAMWRTADWLATHTTPNERVQTYGMDPYVLFLARRRSATPYIYAYDLDVDAALHGSFDPGGLRPTPNDEATIRALRSTHEADLVGRFQASPPAAIVFIDRSPLLAYVEARPDFDVHCPDAAAWIDAHRYTLAVTVEPFHVWVREKE
jgi:hypothetical protein